MKRDAFMLNNLDNILHTETEEILLDVLELQEIIYNNKVNADLKSYKLPKREKRCPKCAEKLPRNRRFDMRHINSNYMNVGKGKKLCLVCHTVHHLI